MISPWDCRRILAVDNSIENLETLTTVLADGGLTELRNVSDPTTALAAFHELRPDLVLLRLPLPDVDASALLAQMHAGLDDDDYVPVIVLTDDLSDESRDQAWAAGADDFLTTPLDRTDVILRVRNLLRTRTLHTRLRQDNRDLARRLRLHEERRRWLVEERRTREERIQDLLGGDRLKMVFQPIVELSSGKAVGAEALARFDTQPVRSPDLWFAEAKEVGLGAQLELAAISAAIGQIDELRRRHVPGSQRVTRDRGVARTSTPHCGARHRNDWPSRSPSTPGSRTTTSCCRRWPPYARPVPGWPSTTPVPASPASATSCGCEPEIIKLDIEITHDIDSDPVRQALAAALVTFGTALGATIIAEGVETQSEFEALQAMGIECGQGFLLGKPRALSLRRARDHHWVDD